MNFPTSSTGQTAGFDVFILHGVGGGGAHKMLPPHIRAGAPQEKFWCPPPPHKFLPPPPPPAKNFPPEKNSKTADKCLKNGHFSKISRLRLLWLFRQFLARFGPQAIFRKICPPPYNYGPQPFIE